MKFSARITVSSLGFMLGILPCLTSCGTTMPYAPKVVSKAQTELMQPGLGNAKRLITEAKRWRNYGEVASVYRLRAGEIIWQELAAHNFQDQTLLKLLNEAQDDLAETMRDSESNTQTFSYAGLTYQITIPAPLTNGAHAPSEFSSLHSASPIKLELCQKRLVESGIGVPLAPDWKAPKGKLEPFVSRRGYLQPITSVLQYNGQQSATGARLATMTLLDPTAVRTVSVNGHQIPLAADFTGPIEHISRGVKEFSLSLLGVFVPQSQEAEVNLLEPYDPKRIPVLFVHGLNSHPRMWRDVYNELRADPELRGKYQFWTYHYPTGWPILYSALRLRQELATLEKVVGRQPGMVLIGHSMGGLVSRLQAISPDRKIWDANLEDSADRLMKKLPKDNLTKQMMLFSRNPDISRLIFVCVPHRGSKIADWSVITFLADLIKLPANLLALATDLPETMAKGAKLNGVNRLSPSNPTYAAMDHTPIPVPYHSIIGDRGKGDTPHSSDGAVEYWSSHLDGAASELILPDNHGAYDNPKAIKEMKRILLLHHR